MAEDREISKDALFLSKLRNALKHYPIKKTKFEFDTEIKKLYVTGPSIEKEFYLENMFLYKDVHDIVYYVLTNLNLGVYVTDLNAYLKSFKTTLMFEPFKIDSVLLEKIPKNQLQFSWGFDPIFIDISKNSYIKVQNYLYNNTSNGTTLEGLCKNLTNREILKLLLKLTTYVNCAH